MSVKEKRRVLMLPVNKASNIWLTEHEVLMYTDTPIKALTNQHLYIISDEEIKEGDWCICTRKNDFNYGKVVQNKLTPYNVGKEWNKIIASTDKSLSYSFTKEVDLYKDIPQQLQIPLIPESFIKVYIEEYNKGNIIEWVNVEYEEVNILDGCYSGYSEEELVEHAKRTNKMQPDEYIKKVLKLRKDNTIVIHKIKDVFTREEVLKVLDELISTKYEDIVKVYEAGEGEEGYDIMPNSEFKVRDWFNENH